MSDRRSPEAQAWRRWYSTARWRRVRKTQFGKQPLCERCEAKGFRIVATICDHDDPATKLSAETFFAGPFSSLCKPCHDGPKQSQERGGNDAGQIGYSKEVGVDGLPVDPRHPFYR
jgi:5-methylcytosine-specific restriction protein A